jgi:hypothetical protein
MEDKTTSTGSAGNAAVRGTKPIRAGLQMASLAALAFAACYLRLFVLPHTTLLTWSDQLEYATKGVRILGGELPYRDFFEFLTPGTDLVYALLFRLLGVGPWMPNLVMCVLLSITVLWITWCAQRLVRGWYVVLPAALAMATVLSGATDASHHWFSTAAALGAVWVLFSGDSLGRVAGAGAFCGLAASFTQTKGTLITLALIAYFLWIGIREKDRTGLWWRRSLVMCGAAIVAFAAINGPLIYQAGLTRWAWDVIEFPLRYASSVSANNWTGVLPAFEGNLSRMKWINYPVQFIGVPLVYLWFFVRMRRARQQPREPWNQLLLLALVGVAMMAAVATMPSVKRLTAASPPVLLLLTWLLSTSRRARTAMIFGAASVGIAASQIALIQLRPEKLVDLPSGRAAIPPKTNYYELYRWMAENTRPGQWFYGLHTLMLPFELRNPTPIEQLGGAEFSQPEQVAEVVEGIEKKKVPIMILWSSIYTPGAGEKAPDHLQPFRDYLFGHYRKTKSFAGVYEVWQRVDK